MIDVKHYVGETGLLIILNCGMNVSTATVTEIHVKTPDGVEVVWTAAVYTLNGVTNCISYTTTSFDFNQPGVYSLQAYIEIPANSTTWKGLGETASITVYNKYE